MYLAVQLVHQGRGVPAGASRPIQVCMTMFGIPASRMVGTSAISAECLSLISASAVSLPDLR